MVLCAPLIGQHDEKGQPEEEQILRLALTGQLGMALTSKNMTETMKLCVSCKACKRECPTG